MKNLVENYFRFLYHPDAYFKAPDTMYGISPKNNARLNLKYGYYTMQKVSGFVKHAEVLMMGAAYKDAMNNILEAIELIADKRDPELLFILNLRACLIELHINRDTDRIVSVMTEIDKYYNHKFPDWVYDKDAMLISALRAMDLAEERKDKIAYEVAARWMNAYYLYLMDQDKVDIGVSVSLVYCAHKIGIDNKVPRRILSFLFSNFDDNDKKREICEMFKTEFEVDYFDLMR